MWSNIFEQCLYNEIYKNADSMLLKYQNGLSKKLQPLKLINCNVLKMEEES